MTDAEASMILDTPKGGTATGAAHAPTEDFAARTAQASGDPVQLHRDAVDVSGFLDMVWPRVRAILQPLRDYRVLDVGCGYGRYAPFLSAFSCADYLGVDAVPDRIAYARNRYGGRCAFTVADIRSPVDGQYELVWCSTVIQHLPLSGKLAALRTIRTAMAPGGTALIWEGLILRLTIQGCAAMYQDPMCAAHMIPTPFGVFAEAFSGCRIEKLHAGLYEVTAP